MTRVDPSALLAQLLGQVRSFRVVVALDHPQVPVTGDCAEFVHFKSIGQPRRRLTPQVVESDIGKERRARGLATRTRLGDMLRTSTRDQALKRLRHTVWSQRKHLSFGLHS